MLENVNGKYVLEASMFASLTFITVLILRYFFPDEDTPFLMLEEKE